MVKARSGLIRALVFLTAHLSTAAPVDAAGFQYATAPDPDDQPLELAIWYPSDGKTSSQPLGLFTQEVAYYGAIKGDRLPVVVISHGTGGSAAEHYDTALALADAGFVVVALAHTGDNYKDRKYSLTLRNLTDRPKHVGRVIDFMLNAWGGHDHLDPARIGVFGHSAGATTALIAIGGNPALYLITLYCRDHADDWSCQERRRLGAMPAADSPAPEWHHEPRIKAAVLAAPATGYAFSKVGLETVIAPVQLWRAEDDKITPNKLYGDIVRDELPQPAEDHFVANAGHFDFLAPCSEALAKAAPAICESAPGFDRAAFHAEMNRDIVAFFKTQLPP